MAANTPIGKDFYLRSPSDPNFVLGVYESNDPSNAWTGEVRTGEHFAPNGAYSWTAVIVSKSTGAKKELSGSILIVR